MNILVLSRLKTDEINKLEKVFRIFHLHTVRKKK